MISPTRIGTIAFTALTQTRASELPNSSIAFAPVSTMRLIDSISIRAFAMTSTFLPRLEIRFPNASRPKPRLAINSIAFSAAPTDLMQ